MPLLVDGLKAEKEQEAVSLPMASSNDLSSSVSSSLLKSSIVQLALKYLASVFGKLSPLMCFLSSHLLLLRLLQLSFPKCHMLSVLSPSSMPMLCSLFRSILDIVVKHFLVLELMCCSMCYHSCRLLPCLLASYNQNRDGSELAMNLRIRSCLLGITRIQFYLAMNQKGSVYLAMNQKAEIAVSEVLGNALAAASSPLGVMGGALAGHGLATLLAVHGGSLLGNFLSVKVIGYVGSVLSSFAYNFFKKDYYFKLAVRGRLVRIMFLKELDFE
nr:protein PAM71, chloroplastic-like [Tanacetum cinerariifolium]